MPKPINLTYSRPFTCYGQSLSDQYYPIIDFMKAFDKVPHRCLLTKLSSYNNGIREYVLYMDRDMVNTDIGVGAAPAGQAMA